MSRILFLFLFAILLVPSVVGLFHPGLFVTDDGGWMVIRLSAFYDALRHGQFPVRFLPRLNSGYGYPVSDFLYPLYLYLGIMPKLIKIGFVDTIKILFGLGVILSGVFSYLWLRRIFGKLSSLAGSIVYVFFPYHIWDMYHRGSIGEILSLAVLPLILWQIESGNFLWVGLSIGILITAHNSLALLFLPLIILYLILRGIFSFKKSICIFLIGFGVSAFFWIPALYDKQFTVFDKISVSDSISYLRWEYSIQFFGLIGLWTFFCVIWHFFRRAKDNKLYLFSFVLFIVFVLTIPYSFLIWKFLPGKELIQFPFRLYSLVIPASSYIIAKTIEQLDKKIFLVILTIILSYLSSIFFIFPKNYSLLPDTYYSTNTDSTTVHNEYMPVYVKSPISNLQSQNEQIIKGRGQIIDDNTNGTNVRFNIVGITSTIAQVNFIYFPGWQVYIDGNNTTINYANRQGLIQFLVPSGRHVIIATFGETGLRIVSDIISIVSICIVLFLSFYFRKKTIHLV